jgi:putative SOS response-associated peptidase YedK
MCGRYTLRSEEVIALIRAIAEVDEGLAGEFKARFNVAPTQRVPVIVADAKLTGGKVQALMMQWGLIPNWSKEKQHGYSMINTRRETLLDPAKRYWREQLRSRRCVVPATGFYEWKKTGTKTKIPFHIAPRSGLLYFAGLWDSWRGPAGEVIDTFSIVTCPSAGNIAGLHDRMPVFLNEDSLKVWLDPSLRDVEKLSALLDNSSVANVELTEVSTLVNSPRNDLAECLEAVAKPA